MSAVTTASSSHVDPFKSSKFTVQLGSSLQTGSPSDRPRTIVTFNHKPAQTVSKRNATLNQKSSNGCDYELLLEDEQDSSTEVFKYAGRRLSDNASYMLTLNKETQTFTLEAVSQEYAMNLIATPQESNPRKLQHEYGEVPTGQASSGRQDSDAGSDAFDSDADEPDSSNPFDYRHYLNEAKPSLSTQSPTLTSAPASRPLTPNDSILHGKDADASLAKSTSSAQRRAPRSAPAKPRTAAKEAKPTPVKRAPGRKPNGATATQKPAEGEIIIEPATDKTSKKPASKDSAASFGGLLVEVDPDSQPKKKKRRNLLGTPSGGGPISLHSITKSPVPTFAASPPPMTMMERGNTNELASGSAANSNNGSGYDGEDDDDREDDDHDRHHHHHHQRDEQRHGGRRQHSSSHHHQYHRADRDVDVDQFELPSPAVVAARATARQRRESTWDADDAADFEAELEQAFEESGVEDAADDDDDDADDADAAANNTDVDANDHDQATAMQVDSRAGRPVVPPPLPRPQMVASAHESEEESEEE